MSADLERVREHIEGIHEFFTDWVSGNCPGDDATFQAGLLDRIAPETMVIMPGGIGYPAEVFTRYMRGLHGSNPAFRIQIRAINVCHQVGDALVVTYEEWERNAQDSTPPDNGRLSTMVLRNRGDRLQILHVHETWLPSEVMAAGPYDF